MILLTLLYQRYIFFSALRATCFHPRSRTSGVFNRCFNKSKQYVLIIDGDHLIGAKQNRVVNKTIIIPPKSDVTIPVSCTEKGRWHFVSRNFSKSRWGTPSAVRNILKQKRTAQSEVWHEVRKRMASFGVHSATSSLEDVYSQIDPKIEDYKKAFKPLPSQVGFMVFINGEFAGLDLLDSPSLFSELENELSSGYMMDAAYSRGNRKTKKSEKVSKEEILRHLIKTKTKRGETIGVEKRTSITSNKVAGEYVSFEEKPVHLALFPKDVQP